MKAKGAYQKWIYWFFATTLAFLLIAGTFPATDWGYGPGIDSPLSWLYNHLFATQIDLTKHIIFPHGPLAFLMYPLPPNLTYAVLFNAIIKVGIGWNLWFLVPGNKWKKLGWSFVLTYLFSSIALFLQLIVTLILTSLVNHKNKSHPAFLVMAISFAALSVYIRAYIGIVALLLVTCYCMYQFVRSKHLKWPLYLLLLSTIISFIWWSLFGSFEGLGNYFVGWLNLAQDNSSAAAFYPLNNWWYLSGMLLGLAVLLLINRNEFSLFYFFVVGPALFGAWKHGMAREDNPHTAGFILFVLSACVVFVIQNKDHRIRNSLISVASIILFLLNVQYVGLWDQNYLPFTPNQFSHFTEFVSSKNQINQRVSNESQQAIAPYILPTEISREIGTDPADIYPWDYAIVAANALNWKPRPVIQSYASYTSWLDQQNSQYFESDAAPKWLIWQKNTPTVDVNSGELNSIDHRYLLNDEPQTMLRIWQHYSLAFSTPVFAVLKRNKRPIPFSVDSLPYQSQHLNQWMEVPPFQNGITRAQVQFSKSMTQRLKSFFYKDEQFWVYMKLHNGTIHKYRIVPKNANDGIWIAPYLYTFNRELTVDSILFTASNQNILNPAILVRWENYRPNSEINWATQVLDTPNTKTDSVMFYNRNNLKNTSSFWSAPQSVTLENQIPTETVGPNSYSSIFELSLDSLPLDSLVINSSCWLRAPHYKLTKNIGLIYSIEYPDGKVWEGTTVDYQLVDRTQFNHIFKTLNFPNTPGAKLKVYLWNTSESPCEIQDFEVQITSVN